MPSCAACVAASRASTEASAVPAFFVLPPGRSARRRNAVPDGLAGRKYMMGRACCVVMEAMRHSDGSLPGCSGAGRGCAVVVLCCCARGGGGGEGQQRHTTAHVQGAWVGLADACVSCACAARPAVPERLEGGQLCRRPRCRSRCSRPPCGGGGVDTLRAWHVQVRRKVVHLHTRQQAPRGRRLASVARGAGSGCCAIVTISLPVSSHQHTEPPSPARARCGHLPCGSTGGRRRRPPPRPAPSAPGHQPRCGAPPTTSAP